MTRLLILAGTGAAWILMMTALFKRDVLPYFQYQAPPSYRDVLVDLREPELTRGEILAAGAKVGEIESMAERMHDQTCRIRTVASLKARLPAVAGRKSDELHVRLKSETLLDILYRLDRTSCEIDLGFGVASILGVRDGDQLKARLKVGQGDRILGEVKQTLDLPKEGMIGDLFQPFPGGANLFIGKKWRIPTMTADLMGPKIGWLYAVVTDRERIPWQDGEVDTHRVEIRTEPTEEKRPTHISWIRDDGIAVRQQFTFESLVYEIVFVSRVARTRGEAHAWGRRAFRGWP
jgi:hypothetical protein